MIKHCLKIAIRNLVKYKVQSAVSILGLAVGFVCFSLSLYWIHYEMTYDHFRQNADRMLYDLLDQGYPAFLLAEDGFFKVQVGAYRQLGNAIL